MNARKLHIGAGRVYIPGWTNIDLFDTHQADIYCDLTRLPFDPGTFDLVYASHVLEHVHRKEVVATLFHWGQMLKPGGVLRIAVPNFEAVAKRYLVTKNLPELMGLLYGGQNHPRNNHFVTFDKPTLTEAFTRAGLKDVREWDWHSTDHAQYDDYSQCFLPHLDKMNGQLMSLNMEATR